MRINESKGKKFLSASPNSQIGIMYYFAPKLVIEKVLDVMLSTEPNTFVHGLTTFPGLGLDNLYCRCSEDMESWRDKCNRDHGEIPFSCDRWFSTMKGLKGHCGRKNGDPWHDLFMKFLEFR